MQLSSQEIGRKLLHLFALLMPFAILYAPVLCLPEYLVPAALGSLFAGSVIIEFLRFRVPMIQKLFFAMFGSMLRKEEDFKVTGSTWIIGAAFLCSILFSNNPGISFVVLTLFVLGDAAAALVGISIGRIKIGKKSLEGSLACFITCILVASVLFPLVPCALDSWSGRMPMALISAVALVITVFELIPLKIYRNIVINDNFAVPVIAGYTIILVEHIMI